MYAGVAVHRLIGRPQAWGVLRNSEEFFNTPFVMLCHAKELMRGIVSDRLGNDEKRKNVGPI